MANTRPKAVNFSVLARRTFILAPDVLMKYPGIIPGTDEASDPPSALIVPAEDDPLYNGRLIIPEVTLDALDEAANNLTRAGLNAACALRRIMRLVESQPHTLQETLNLKAFTPTGRGTSGLAILPIAEAFVAGIPWNPTFDEDTDGIVALTALEATCIAAGRFTNGAFDEVNEFGETYFKLIKSLSIRAEDYCLVTNRPLAVAKARMLGIETMSCNLPEPLPHTGIRYYLVSNGLYDKFQADGSIDFADWQDAFPNEPPLIHNEYIVMYPLRSVAGYFPCLVDPSLKEWQPMRLDPQSKIVKDNPVHNYCGYHDYSYVGVAKNSTSTIIHLKHIDSPSSRQMIPFNNPEYAAYVDALHDPEIDTIIVTGPAGTGKTYGAFNTALDECIERNYVHTMVVKDGKHALGAVPGDVEQKMAPMVGFGKDAIGARYSRSDEVQRLRNKEQRGEANGSSAHERIQENINMKWSKNFTSVPYEDAQGRSFPDCFIILDEFQRVNVDTADTLLTRLGDGSKMVVMGDIDQIYDATEVSRTVNGLIYAHELFLDEPCAAAIHLIRGQRSDSTSTIIRNRAAVRAKLGLKN